MAIDVYKEWLGIPDGPRPPDHYQLLRLVQFEDVPDKIRANYKKLNAHVRRYATGQYSDESQALLNELAKAMLCLTDSERKREYDISLGRVIEEAETGPKTIDVILLEQKHVSPSQAEEARNHSERTGLDLRDSFVQLKFVEPEIAAQALAQELGLPFVDLAETLPEDEILDQVPRATVKQHSILPLFLDGGVLLVACTRLIEPELEDELRLRFGGAPVRSVLAAPMAINQAIARYYAPGVRNEAAAKSAVKGGEKELARKKAEPAAKPKRRERRSDEEVSDRRKLGIIIVNSSFLLAYLLDSFVITPGVFGDKWTYLLFTVLPGITALVVSQTHWKK